MATPALICIPRMTPVVAVVDRLMLWIKLRDTRFGIVDGNENKAAMARVAAAGLVFAIEWIVFWLIRLLPVVWAVPLTDIPTAETKVVEALEVFRSRMVLPTAVKVPRNAGLVPEPCNNMPFTLAPVPVLVLVRLLKVLF